MDKWIAEAVGLRHINHITQKQLSEKLGYSREYTVRVLNGRDAPPNIEARVMTAIAEIISERGAMEEVT